jgi:hypothetical protein
MREISDTANMATKVPRVRFSHGLDHLNNPQAGWACNGVLQLYRGIRLTLNNAYRLRSLFLRPLAGQAGIKGRDMRSIFVLDRNVIRIEVRMDNVLVSFKSLHIIQWLYRGAFHTLLAVIVEGEGSGIADTR